MDWTLKLSKAGWDLDFFRSGEWQVIEEKFDELEQKGFTINPKRKDMFKALVATPSSEVRVVIVGQDPYPNSNLATGIAFDIPLGVVDFPLTLRNIFNELQSDLGYLHPRNGSLLQWTNHGVLLLNAIPSCTAGQPASHRWGEWEYFAREIVEKLDVRNIPMVLLGRVARDLRKFIVHSPVVETSHPSPLGAGHGFMGSKIFSKVNDILVNRGDKPIDWRLECSTPVNMTKVSNSKDTFGFVPKAVGSLSGSIHSNSQMG